MAELEEKIHEALTEARMVLPGTQALLGFQLIVMFSEGFHALPESSRWVHLASLALTALSGIWLMSPAAYHRIVERGEESERFHDVASAFLLAAMAALALGITGDYFVVARLVTGSRALAAVSAGLLLAVLYGLWFVVPLVARKLKR